MGSSGSKHLQQKQEEQQPAEIALPASAANHLVDEVGKLFALDGVVAEPPPRVGEGGGSGMVGAGDASSRGIRSSRASWHSTADVDLQSKSTASTKGSPDWSFSGADVSPHAGAAVSGGLHARSGMILSAAAQTRAPLFRHQQHHCRSVSGGGTPDDSNHQLSRSPFSRLLFRRGGNSHQRREDDYPHPPQQQLNLPSTVVVKQQQQPHLGQSCQQQNSTARIPVNKRRSRRFLDYYHDHDEEDGDDEASEMHLQQLYDLRTWDLYMRITDARKQRQLEQEQRRSQSRPHHLIPHARTDHEEAGTEPTSSPDSDYGWYDEYQSQHHPQHLQLHPSPGVVAVAGAVASAPSQTSSHELIFGDPEL